MMQFNEWLELNERSLYHGTIIDNEPSIKKYGLVGGWNGIGSFVSHWYDEDDYTPSEKDEVIFMSDKQSLNKSLNAIIHHVSKKLNKDFHDVTENDIRNHGLLVISKDIDNMPKYDSKKYQGYENIPLGAEDGDYYTSEVKGDLFLKGAALIRFFKNHGIYPGIDDKKKSNKFYRDRLAAMAISKGVDKQKSLDTTKSSPMKDILHQLKQWN